ncbi:MAG TPA: hypothetical protein VF867_00110 [Arthrobacter sp.]
MSPFKVRWSWRDPVTMEVLPERYTTKAKALENRPRAGNWRLVRIAISDHRDHHKKEAHHHSDAPLP